MTSSALVLLAAACCAPAAGLRRFEAVEPHMGTLFRIVLYADDPGAAHAAFAAAFSRIAYLDGMLSDYRPDSELSRLCRAGAGVPRAVSPELFTVLESAQALAGDTGGAFDIAQGPVIRLWREARRARRLPDPAALAEAARHAGYRKLRLDRASRTVQLADDGMQLDLGGIAKGYAADEALRVLAGLGMRRALVAASGDLAIGDAPPGKKGWTVGIDSLGAPEDGFNRVLTLARRAVSTSGDASQYAEIAGARYSHIIDPASHRALSRRIGVTVVARRAIDSDSLATAVSVLGAERGLRFIERRTDAAALIVTPGGVLECRLR